MCVNLLSAVLLHGARTRGRRAAAARTPQLRSRRSSVAVSRLTFRSVQSFCYYCISPHETEAFLRTRIDTRNNGVARVQFYFVYHGIYSYQIILFRAIICIT